MAIILAIISTVSASAQTINVGTVIKSEKYVGITSDESDGLYLTREHDPNETNFDSVLCGSHWIFASGFELRTYDHVELYAFDNDKTCNEVYQLMKSATVNCPIVVTLDETHRKVLKVENCKTD